MATREQSAAAWGREMGEARVWCESNGPGCLYESQTLEARKSVSEASHCVGMKLEEESLFLLGIRPGQVGLIKCRPVSRKREAGAMSSYHSL